MISEYTSNKLTQFQHTRTLQWKNEEHGIPDRKYCQGFWRDQGLFVTGGPYLGGKSPET